MRIQGRALLALCGVALSACDSGAQGGGAGGTVETGASTSAGGQAPEGGAPGTGGQGGVSEGAGATGASSPEGGSGPGCEPVGASVTSSADCCSHQKDDFDQCCSGSGCCASFNHSHASGANECSCEDGYVWASDAPTDFRCELPSAHVVDCSGQTTDPMWCECTPQDDNSGTVQLEGSCHTDPSFAPMSCCADNGFPGAGSCACYLSQPWRCMAFFDECTCSYYWDASASEYLTNVCDNVPEPDGTPWHCCLSPYGHCDCEANANSCPAGETPVADCTQDWALGFNGFSGCEAGEHWVPSCDGGGSGGNCDSSSDCPGDCTGTDPVCCPTCDGGTCGQTCCFSDGSCF